MIWALTLKPGQECTHEGLEEIHLSLASLECRPGKCQAGTDGSDLISYLLLKSGHTEQVLCTLEKGHSTQQNLDLVLQPRERVTFSVEGSGIVYVTGYSTSLPVDESEEEEEGIMGRIEYEELNPLHTVVKQEPEDDTCWELRYDESEDGLLNSATICGVPESPHFLEEEEQMPHDEEEEFEQLNQPCEPLEIAGDQHSKIFEQDTVLIKVDPEEAPAEDEDTRNVEIQGEISGGNIHESDTAGVFSGGIASCTRNAAHTTQAAGDINDVPMKVTVTQQNENVTENDHLQTGIASRTRNAVHTTQSAGDTSDVPMKVTETKLNKSNTENDHTPCDNSNMARNGEGSVIESTTSRKNELGAQASGRHPRPTITRVLPTRRGKVSSLASHSVNSNNTSQNCQRTSVKSLSDMICQICGKRLSSRQYRMIHEKRHASRTPDGENSQTPQEAIIDPSVCQICGKKFSSKYYRVKHEKLHPPTTSSNSCNNQTGGLFYKTSSNTSISDDVLCQICGKRFSSKYYRIEHEKLHIPTKTHKCRYCDQTFTMRSERIAHESCHKKKKSYSCKFCGKGFRKNWLLCDHENTHTGKKPYKCKFCFKAYGAKSSLFSHENTHTGDKSFVCQVCGKSFPRKHRLKEHMNIHTGNRPYKCKYCYKTYIRKDHLRCHELTHGKEDRFTCQICHKGFYRKKDLLDHGNIHSGLTPYVCSFCSKGFSGERNMRKHMRVVHMVRQRATSLPPK